MNFPPMAQAEGEFEKLLDRIEPLEPKSILEIGVWQGGTLTRFAHRFPNATIIGIDPAPQIEKCDFDNVIIITGKSQHPPTRAVALHQLSPTFKFDVVYIDGDHTYNSVVDDWNWAWTIANKAIIFHDIVDSNNPELEVHKLWDEIHRVKHYDTEEIKLDGGGYGIGIIYL